MSDARCALHHVHFCSTCAAGADTQHRDWSEGIDGLVESTTDYGSKSVFRLVALKRANFSVL